MCVDNCCKKLKISVYILFLKQISHKQCFSKKKNQTCKANASCSK